MLVLSVAMAAAFGIPGCAAQLCAGYALNGYRDWFLPSRDELDLMYRNLKSQGLGNFTQAALCAWYWPSSESDTHSAWNQYFGDGRQYSNYKYSRRYVRAVRAF
jgi:hypothetical protein